MWNPWRLRPVAGLMTRRPWNRRSWKPVAEIQGFWLCIIAPGNSETPTAGNLKTCEPRYGGAAPKPENLEAWSLQPGSLHDRTTPQTAKSKLEGNQADFPRRLFTPVTVSHFITFL